MTGLIIFSGVEYYARTVTGVNILNIQYTEKSRTLTVGHLHITRLSESKEVYVVCKDPANKWEWTYREQDFNLFKQLKKYYSWSDDELELYQVLIKNKIAEGSTIKKFYQWSKESFRLKLLLSVNGHGIIHSVEATFENDSELKPKMANLEICVTGGLSEKIKKEASRLYDDMIERMTFFQEWIEGGEATREKIDDILSRTGYEELS